MFVGTITKHPPNEEPFRTLGHERKAMGKALGADMERMIEPGSRTAKQLESLNLESSYQPSRAQCHC